VLDGIVVERLPAFAHVVGIVCVVEGIFLIVVIYVAILRLHVRDIFLFDAIGLRNRCCRREGSYINRLVKISSLLCISVIRFLLFSVGVLQPPRSASNISVHA